MFTIPGPSRIRLPEERPRPEEPPAVDELDLQVERRREIYQYGLFAKVRPAPAPALLPIFPCDPLPR